MIDEAGPALDRVDFFNYGETFLHKRAVEMCEYIKQRFPRIYLYTSTNGLALTEAQATRLVHSGIDEVTFSVDGAFPESYARYRRRGRLDAALHTMRAMTREKRRAGRDLPFINWRYILFKWNDSTEEMRHARKLADEIGVDRLTWEITDHPESAFSRRFAPGTADHAAIRHEIWDENNLGNAIPERLRAPASICTPWRRDFRWSGGAAPGSDYAHASATCRAAPSRPRRPTAAGSYAWAPSSARPTER